MISTPIVAAGACLAGIDAPTGDEGLSPAQKTAVLDRIYRRGDQLMWRFILLHFGIAFTLAFAYETWLITGVVTFCAVGMFAVGAILMPRSFITRCLAGVSLQTFVALHIYQLHGLAEMHFFFFTGFTMLIVYQDWKCMWPGALGIIIQHIGFAALHNAGTPDLFFFQEGYVGFTKLFFHFGIALGEVALCGYWAFLLHRQTLASAGQNARLQAANEGMLAEAAERRRVEGAMLAAEVRQRRIIANVPGMVYQYLLTPAGISKLTFVSDGCREIYGVEPARLMDDPNFSAEAVHPEDRQAMAAAIRASAATLQPYRWEGRLQLPGEPEKWVQAASRPELQANGDIIWDGVVTDITEQKLAAEGLVRAKDEAERANAAKSEFLSRMSHELRTPLNAILGFGQLMEMDPLDPCQRQGVEHILKAGRHLLGLINEILDIARIEAGRAELAIEPVSVSELLEESIALVRPLASPRRIRLLLDPSDPDASLVRADRQRLKQILLNLLSNAIKYNREGGAVRVSCRRVGLGRGRLSVTDTGAGITPGQLGKLFTPFERLDAAQRGIHGTGIGLVICKRLVEAMNGTLSVESSPDEGSTFTVELPTADAPEILPLPAVNVEDSPPPAAPGPVPTVRVLHIEDSPSNLHLIEMLFARRGDIRLLAAMQGGLGLELAREHHPELILLDLDLPDLSGAEVLVRLRAEPRTADIPVIVLSADANHQQIRRLLDLGARDYLTKPFNVAKFFQVVDEALASHHLHAP